MPELPVISYIDAVKVFERAGWNVKRSATHIIMTKPGSMASLSIPRHSEIARGDSTKIDSFGRFNY